MNFSQYTFIDGGAVREGYKRCMREYHGCDGDLDLVRSGHVLQRDSYKVFYYDCLDDQPKADESPEDCRARIANQQAEFDGLRARPGWHVREGLLVGAKPRRRQKRVDVLLAVEMLGHAFSKNMQVAHLYSNDDDFTPLVNELLRHGTYVAVLTDRWHASQHLGPAADACDHLDYFFYHKLSSSSFQRLHPPPQHGVELGVNPIILKTGRIEDGSEVAIVESWQGPENRMFQFRLNRFSEPGVMRWVPVVGATELKTLQAYLRHDYEKGKYAPDSWR